MPSIIVHYDPSGISKRDEHSVDAGTVLSDWIMKAWPDGLSVPTQININSVLTPIKETDGYKIREHDVIEIIRTPQDPATIIAIVAVTVSLASAFLLRPNIPIQETPEFQQAQESPNNALSGQTNIARPLQRIPDIYGKNLVFPDLILKSYFEFVNNIKYVNEYLCIGRGEYLVEEVKSGDTLITDIDGAVFTLFEPDTAPATLLNVDVSNEVDGQQVYGPNEGGTLDIPAVSVLFNTVGFISADSAISPMSELADGDPFTIANATDNNGNFTLSSFEFDAETSIYTIITNEATTATVGLDVIKITSTSAKKDTIGPFRVPNDTTGEEIWIDIQAPRGLQDGTGSPPVTLTINFEAQLQRLTAGGAPTGPLQTENFLISDNTVDPRFYTFKFTPDFPGDPYEVSIKRTTNTNDTAGFLDQTKWTRLAGVEDLNVTDFGNVTTVFITTKATEQATSIQQRKFNAIVTRKLITFDTGTQTFTTTPAATAKMADAVFDYATDPVLGNKPVSQVDVDELYAIQDSLDSVTFYGDTLGRCCYSFSNDRTPVQDELKTLLNTARSMFYPEGQTLRFVRDETKPNRVILFTPRTKKPASESKTVKFFKPGDQDGIELRWVDEATGEPATILLPAPSGGSNNLRINAAGIKNFPQAFNRATYEFDKLKLQRTNVSITVGEEGILPRLNDRVGNVDATNINSQGSEIITIEVDGKTAGTDQEVDFDGSGDGTVILRNSAGDVSTPLACTPRFDGVSGFILTSSPPESIFVRNGIIQIGTLYSFFPTTDAALHDANDYLVGKIDPQSDGYVNLVLVNYRDEIYDADTTAPPS